MKFRTRAFSMLSAILLSIFMQFTVFGVHKSDAAFLPVGTESYSRSRSNMDTHPFYIWTAPEGVSATQVSLNVRVGNLSEYDVEVRYTARVKVNGNLAYNSIIETTTYPYSSWSRTFNSYGKINSFEVDLYESRIPSNSILVSGDITLGTDFAEQQSIELAIEASEDVLNAVNSTDGNTIMAVRDGNGTVLDASRAAENNALNAYNEANAANTKIDNIQTTVNFIEYSLGQDSFAPEVRLRTFSGATATSGNTIRAVVNVSDNASTVFLYSYDGTGYQPLPADKLINLPVASNGANLITVYVKDEAGNVGMDSLTVRKL